MPRTATYSLIASYTVPSATSSYTFSSIPGTFTDLLLIANMQGSASAYNNMAYPLIRFNSDSGTNYSYTEIFARNTGGGETAVSSRASNIDGIKTIANTSTVFSPNIFQVLDYANATTYKTALNRGNGNNGTTNVDGTQALVGMWRNTAAITSITIYAGGGNNLVAASTFKLYGIQAGNA